MDLVADTLTRIQNGIKVGKTDVSVMKSNLIKSVLLVLKYEGMINGFEETDSAINVSLKYVGGEPMVAHFSKVSKPGQRIYVSSNEIIPVMNGRGIAIISTSKGVMSGAVAKSKKLGGEYLCNVW